MAHACIQQCLGKVRINLAMFCLLLSAVLCCCSCPEPVMYSTPIVMLNYTAFLSMLHASPLQHEQNNTTLSSFFHHTYCCSLICTLAIVQQHTTRYWKENHPQIINYYLFSSNKQLPTESCFFDIIIIIHL